MLDCSRHDAAQAAFRAVVRAGAASSLDFAHVPVTIAGGNYAASARVMPSGTLMIELDAVPPCLTPRVITGDAWRAGLLQARAHGGKAVR
ncbi:hypothetical protein AiwAL_19170 [Acidiphilium sp. AL]|uniref:Uncharacterized protein n=1 Tax=Acidiphilium iwatense TaxID=768198 RepID=A0ABS9E311_9PROT|nr:MULTISPECIES: hypothetical protein [Acidiphilium]MCF3948770.1 hypothetical protein [Acidiphilium iwatense]MCU4162175.1 hypothetical protein [Acidiphilium sp. AL]